MCLKSWKEIAVNSYLVSRHLQTGHKQQNNADGRSEILILMRINVICLVNMMNIKKNLHMLESAHSRFQMPDKLLNLAHFDNDQSCKRRKLLC